MTIDESKAQLVEILTAAAAAAGGEWDHHFDNATEPCRDRTTERHSLVSYGAGSEDPAGAAARVKGAWDELGYEGFVREGIFDSIEVMYPHDENGLAFSYAVNGNAQTLGGVSVCVPAE